MVSAIQSLPNEYTAGQIINLASISRLTRQATALLAPLGAIVNLGVATAPQVTYNAFGLLDTASPGVTPVVNDSTSSLAIISAPDASTNDLASRLVLALEARSTAANSVILDEALADSLAKQIAINASAIAVGLNASFAPPSLAPLLPTDATPAGTAISSETNRQIQARQMEAAANSARTLDSLLFSETIPASIVNPATSNQEDAANRATVAAVPVLTTPTQSAAKVVIEATETVAATTTNVVAASNTTSPATTVSSRNAAEVVNAPIRNSRIDSGAQAFATVAQNPAYANLVAGHFASLAASATQSPAVMTTPNRLEEIKPVIAISAISALTALGAQSGRDGNPAFGFRQRRANPIPDGRTS